MRFYLERHKFYCGIDLHARRCFCACSMSKCQIVLHRNIKTDPDSLRRVLQPFREGLVIGVNGTLSLVLAR